MEGESLAAGFRGAEGGDDRIACGVGDVEGAYALGFDEQGPTGDSYQQRNGSVVLVAAILEGCFFDLHGTDVAALLHAVAPLAESIEGFLCVDLCGESEHCNLCVVERLFGDEAGVPASAVGGSGSELDARGGVGVVGEANRYRLSGRGTQ